MTQNDNAARTRETIRALVEQLESSIAAFDSKDMQSVMNVAHIHHAPYSGPTVNLEEMRKAVAQGKAVMESLEETMTQEAAMRHPLAVAAAAHPLAIAATAALIVVVTFFIATLIVF